MAFSMMSTPPPLRAPDPRDVDSRAVRRAFGKAAATYDAAAALREVATRMAQRLDYVKITPTLVLDGGCGTGEATVELGARYPDARLVALDLALPMVVAARARARAGRSLLRRLLPTGLAGNAGPWCVCADLNALPLRGVAFDLVWSNLALQWINDVPRAFAEWRRVLKVGGLVLLTTFGPDTLRRLARPSFASTVTRTPTASWTCTIWVTCWWAPALPIRRWTWRRSP